MRRIISIRPYASQINNIEWRWQRWRWNEMEWNEKRQQQKSNFEMFYILPFVMLTASHTTFVLCGLFYRSNFFHFHSRFTRRQLNIDSVRVCSCCEDENSVSFLQGNCRNYNRSAFQNQKKKIVIVSFIFSPFGWIAWYILLAVHGMRVVWQLMLLVLLDCCWLPLPALYAFI